MLLPAANENSTEGFVDRRQSGEAPVDGRERRQFTNSHDSLTPDARELAEAIDSYKLQNRRRFITFEEMLSVIHSLGYHK
jgi:hypothetical protein